MLIIREDLVISIPHDPNIPIISRIKLLEIANID
jgi:hypothetical protein